MNQLNLSITCIISMLGFCLAMSTEFPEELSSTFNKNHRFIYFGTYIL